MLDFTVPHESKSREPSRIDCYFLDLTSCDAKGEILQYLAERFTIDEIKYGRSVSGRLPFRIGSETACCYQQSFVGASDHRSAKVSNRGSPNTSLISFALEKHMKAQKSNPQYADAIDSSIPASTRDFNSREARLSQNSLAKTLEL